MVRTKPAKSVKLRRTIPPYEETRGRPTKYKHNYPHLAEQICLMCHSLDEVATIAKLAEFFEVDISTVYEWMDVHADFSEAVRHGRAAATANVAKSMYKRAMGYDVEEETITFDEVGKIKGKTVRTRHIPAEAKMVTFALMNWAPEFFRERRVLASDPDHPLIPATPRVLDVSMLDDDTLEVLVGALRARRREDDASAAQATRH